MAIPGGSLTGTSDISNLVRTAYDQYVRMALRSIPVMRGLADVKPVQQAMPGSSVVFSIYSDLAQATSTLTETSDVSSIALGNPNQVTVTLNEYGSAVTTTKCGRRRRALSRARLHHTTTPECDLCTGFGLTPLAQVLALPRCSRRPVRVARVYGRSAVLIVRCFSWRNYTYVVTV